MKSPCIRLCKMHNGFCAGCQRTIEEIKLWSTYSDEKRDYIIDKVIPLRLKLKENKTYDV